MSELRCEHIGKSYGRRTVLRDVDLVVPGGTVTAILGASGSGKTTLLRVIMGLVEADAGAITVGGSPVARAGELHLPPDKRAIGYVAQEGALFPHLTAGENVAFGLPRSQRKRGSRIAELLRLVGLDAGYATRLPQELSGGEQRRVALARALAPTPRLVLLDEPFSGLDAALRAETREAVLHALAQQGSTALLVTHDQAEALSMGREVGVLRDGLLVQRADPRTLYRAPIDPDVASFVGEAILLAGRIRGGRAVCALGEVAVRSPIPAVRDGVQVMIRPEQIRILRGGQSHNGSGAGVSARVTRRTFYGPYTVVELVLSGAEPVTVKARTLETEVPGPDELVKLVVVGPVVTFPTAVPAVDRDPVRART